MIHDILLIFCCTLRRMYSQCLSLGWGFSMDGKLGWCFPGFPSCSNSQKQWKGCFFSKKLEDMFFSMVKPSTQIWGRNVATAILTIDIWGKLHLLSIAVSLEQNKVQQNACASRRWMQEEHRRTGFPYISPMQIELNVHLASKYAFPEFGRVEWGGSRSCLYQSNFLIPNQAKRDDPSSNSPCHRRIFKISHDHLSVLFTHVWHFMTICHNNNGDL